MPSVGSCLTISFNGIANVILCKVGVSPYYTADGTIAPTVKSAPLFDAIWDTGASNTAVSIDLVNRLGIKPIGAVKTSTANGLRDALQYKINVLLPNQVTISAIMATGADLSNGPDLLLGMDVFRLGDAILSNHNGKTVFTFRLPSMQEYDFVKNSHLSPVTVRKLPGRNELCYCGSEKKFKYCHGRP